MNGFFPITAQECFVGAGQHSLELYHAAMHQTFASLTARRCRGARGLAFVFTTEKFVTNVQSIH